MLLLQPHIPHSSPLKPPPTLNATTMLSAVQLDVANIKTTLDLKEYKGEPILEPSRERLSLFPIEYKEVRCFAWSDTKAHGLGIMSYRKPKQSGHQDNQRSQKLTVGFTSRFGKCTRKPKLPSGLRKK